MSFLWFYVMEPWQVRNSRCPCAICYAPIAIKRTCNYTYFKT